MQGSFIDRRVDQPVRFRAGATVLEGKLERVRLLVPEGGAWQLTVIVWFDYSTWKRIDRGHHFGFTIESIDADSFELTSERLVQMELRAEGEARAAVAELTGDALVDRAVAALTGDAAGTPLLDASQYRYLSVYQEREVDGVTFLKGFTSTYRNQG